MIILILFWSRFRDVRHSFSSVFIFTNNYPLSEVSDKDKLEDMDVTQNKGGQIGPLQAFLEVQVRMFFNSLGQNMKEANGPFPPKNKAGLMLLARCGRPFTEITDQSHQIIDH